MPLQKRRWEIRFDPDRSSPYTARPGGGEEAIFISSQGLVRFLSRGGLNEIEIQIVMKRIHSFKAGGRAWVELEE